MDKNTIIGFILILAILVGSFWLNKPGEEQIKTAKERERISDSIALVQSQKMQLAEIADSLKRIKQKETETKNIISYGALAESAKGESSISTLENDKMKITFDSKGAKIQSVELKNYVNSDSLPLILFDEKDSEFGLSFFSQDSRLINTSDMFFSPVSSTDSSITFRLKSGEDSYLDFNYTLKSGDYMLSLKLTGNNLDSLMLANTRALDMTWKVKLHQQEKGRKFEDRYSVLDYKFIDDDVESLSGTKEKEIPSKIKWAAFKDQFFACVVISDNYFNSNILSIKKEPETSKYIKSYSMKSSIDFNIRDDGETGMKFYFGPIKHSLLKNYDKGVASENKLHLNRIVPLGGAWVRWANTGIILPLFNLFGKYIHNYGIIILLMTLVIKLIISPLTFKSYMSSAKMRVLQPQITAINDKYPGNENAQKRSQATMALYSKAGVSPMGGCLPMILQMPILFAMYSFFPSSIELRQQSFLWAKDLSSYDAFITWSGNIPILSSVLGNHLSLFCVLMTVTNIVYTYINSKNQPTNSQMPSMKYLMYLMPLMFLFLFNQYSSALSFYFWVSTLITIIQTYMSRAFINEDKILAKLQANQNKPAKKSGFAARLEKMQKEQQKAMRQQAKKGKIK